MSPTTPTRVRPSRWAPPRPLPARAAAVLAGRDSRAPARLPRHPGRVCGQDQFMRGVSKPVGMRLWRRAAAGPECVAAGGGCVLRSARITAWGAPHSRRPRGEAHGRCEAQAARPVRQGRRGKEHGLRAARVLACAPRLLGWPARRRHLRAQHPPHAGPERAGGAPVRHRMVARLCGRQPGRNVHWVHAARQR